MDDVMHINQHEMTTWLAEMFIAAGCPKDEAILIAQHLVDADASGHPSHGIARVPRYMSYITEGTVRPSCAHEILMTSGSLRLIDGLHSFGQVLGHLVVDQAKQMVAQHGLALIGLRNSGHLGRIGGWAELLAESGLVSVHFVTVPGSRIVAPFGGREARISTAPIAIGIPQADGHHFILDFATSRVAEGKVLVSQKTGSKLPSDAMVDKDGKDSDKPFTIYGESATTSVPNPRSGAGAIQTFGQHKGSGLGLACELLAGALTGAGTNAHDRPFGNGMLSLVFRAEDFDTDNLMQQEAQDFVQSIRDCPPREAGKFVQIPGDPERAKRAETTAQGVYLNSTIMDQLVAISDGFGLTKPNMSA
tara:strand:+ start:683 stop:1768 length:1086 start_codon:yes stop_codon:yes gene_type:complete